MNTKELQEAITLMNEHPKTMVYQRTVVEAAQKLLSLYPLLEELCEARDKASQGEWRYEYKQLPKSEMYAGQVFDEDEDNMALLCWHIAKPKKQGVISTDRHHNGNFITTAANTTNQIRKVLDE